MATEVSIYVLISTPKPDREARARIATLTRAGFGVRVLSAQDSSLKTVMFFAKHRIVQVPCWFALIDSKIRAKHFGVPTVKEVRKCLLHLEEG